MNKFNPTTLFLIASLTFFQCVTGVAEVDPVETLLRRSFSLSNEALLEETRKLGLFELPKGSERRTIYDNTFTLGKAARAAHGATRLAWHHVEKGTFEVPIFMSYEETLNPNAPKARGTLARWYLEHCLRNLFIEELSHIYVHRVGEDKALELTPKYSEYLKTTGAPFDAETYVTAILDQFGRRHTMRERSRYRGREVYYRWLRTSYPTRMPGKSNCTGNPVSGCAAPRGRGSLTGVTFKVGSFFVDGWDEVGEVMNYLKFIGAGSITAGVNMLPYMGAQGIACAGGACVVVGGASFSVGLLAAPYTTVPLVDSYYNMVIRDPSPKVSPALAPGLTISGGAPGLIVGPPLPSLSLLPNAQ